MGSENLFKECTGKQNKAQMAFTLTIRQQYQQAIRDCWCHQLFGEVSSVVSARHIVKPLASWVSGTLNCIPIMLIHTRIVCTKILLNHTH